MANNLFIGHVGQMTDEQKAIDQKMQKVARFKRKRTEYWNLYLDFMYTYLTEMPENSPQQIRCKTSINNIKQELRR